MQQPGEPSVEEILESIKKVIARDNFGGLPTRGRSPIDLIEPAADDEAAEVLELDEDTMISLEEEGREARFAGDDENPADAPLTGEATATAMRENLAALAMLAKPSRQPQIVRSGETSLEALTRELLRPMLAQWLDRNLPAMVEEMVKAEIARIAGKKN